MQKTLKKKRNCMKTIVIKLLTLELGCVLSSSVWVSIKCLCFFKTNKRTWHALETYWVLPEPDCSCWNKHSWHGHHSFSQCLLEGFQYLPPKYPLAPLVSGLFVRAAGFCWQSTCCWIHSFCCIARVCPARFPLRGRREKSVSPLLFDLIEDRGNLL